MHLCGMQRQVPLCPQPKCLGKQSYHMSGRWWRSSSHPAAGLGNLPRLCHHGTGSVQRSTCQGEAATQGQAAPTPGKGARGSGNHAGEGSKSEEQQERGCFNPALGHCPVSHRAVGLGRSAALLGNPTLLPAFEVWVEGWGVSSPISTLLLSRGGDIVWLGGTWPKQSLLLD